MNAKNKKAKIRTEIKDLNREDTIEHYNAVLLEQIDSKMSIVIEVMQTTEERLNKKSDDLREEVSQRLGLVETAIKHHSGEIKELKTEMKSVSVKVNGLEQKVDSLTSDVQVLTSDVQVLKSDVHEIKIEMHEMEVRLSDKIDKNGEKVDNHEGRIVNLEKVTFAS